MDFDELYSQRILELAANAPAAPRLDAPHATARRVSRLCGSMIEVDLAFDGERIAAYGHHVRACALGQTSSAIVAANVAGSDIPELLDLRAAVAAMLTEGAAPPTGKWDDFRYLAPVRHFPARHGSTLLVLDAISDAIAAHRAGQGA